MTTTLSIILNVSGDLARNKISYVPSMTNPGIKTNTIYFLPTVRITDKLVREARTGKYGIEVFTDLAAFIKLTRYVQRQRGFTPISISEAEAAGVVESNYEYFRSLLFGRKKDVLIESRAYTIRKSEIAGGSNRPGVYRMTVDADVILKTRAGAVEMKRRDCRDQAKEIDDMAAELFGVSLGLWKAAPPGPDTVLPAMYSSGQTGLASGKEAKQRRHRQYNPFAPPSGFSTPPFGLGPQYTYPYAQAAPANPYATRQPQVPGQAYNLPQAYPVYGFAPPPPPGPAPSPRRTRASLYQQPNSA